MHPSSFIIIPHVSSIRLSTANESAYHRLANDVLAQPLEVAGGMMAVPEGPGLGVEVDRAKVDRFLVD